jgi:hypothetical protein
MQAVTRAYRLYRYYWFSPSGATGEGVRAQ